MLLILVLENLLSAYELEEIGRDIHFAAQIFMSTCATNLGSIEMLNS